MNKTRNYDLENRLIKFACLCLEICEILPFNQVGKNLGYQLSKSGTASALLYGEAQAAESRADFIHKMRVVLKELRETRINLRIIIEKPILSDSQVMTTLKEANELIAIITASLTTVTKKITSQNLE